MNEQVNEQVNEQDIVAEEACIILRGGVRRSRELAAEARNRLSELTSDTVYPGPAAIILTDARVRSDELEQASPVPPAQA